MRSVQGDSKQVTQPIQILVFDPQSGTFRRDYQIEQFFNDYITWWEGGL